MKKIILAFIFALALYPAKSQAGCIVCGSSTDGSGLAALAFGLAALGLLDPETEKSSANADPKATSEFAILNNDFNKLALLNQSAAGSNTAEILAP